MTTDDENDRARIGGNEPPLADRLAIDFESLAAEVEAVAEKANGLPRKILSDDDLGKVGPVVRDASALLRRVDDKRKAEKEPFLTAGRTVDAFFKVHADRLDRIVKVLSDAASDYQHAKAAAERKRRDDEARRLRDEEEKKRREAETAKKAETVARKEAEADTLGAYADVVEARAAAPVNSLVETVTDSGVKVGGKEVFDFRIVDYAAIPLNELRPYMNRDEIEKAIRSYQRIHKEAAKLDGIEFFKTTKATFR